jgi:hypothetical protein
LGIELKFFRVVAAAFNQDFPIEFAWNHFRIECRQLQQNAPPPPVSKVELVAQSSPAAKKIEAPWLTDEMQVRIFNNAPLNIKIKRTQIKRHSGNTEVTHR